MSHRLCTHIREDGTMDESTQRTAESAVQRASELGSAHGQRDAEAWLDVRQPSGWIMRYQLGNGWRLDALAAGYPLPEPDLEGDFTSYDLSMACRGSAWQPSGELDAAYCDAYRAARDATIRQAVQ